MFKKYALALVAATFLVTGCSGSSDGEPTLPPEDRTFAADIPASWSEVESDERDGGEWLWTAEGTVAGSEFVTASAMSASDVPQTAEGRAEYMRLTAESAATRNGGMLEDLSEIQGADGTAGVVVTSTNPDSHSAMSVAVFVDDNGSAWRFVRVMAGTDVEGELSEQIDEFVTDFLSTVSFDGE